MTPGHFVGGLNESYGDILQGTAGKLTLTDHVGVFEVRALEDSVQVFDRLVGHGVALQVQRVHRRALAANGALQPRPLDVAYLVAREVQDFQCGAAGVVEVAASLRSEISSPSPEIV